MTHPAPVHPIQSRFPAVSSWPRRWPYLVAILAITLWAAFLRLWQFPNVPYGLEYDEAMNGIDILYMLKTGDYHLFFFGNHGREGLFFYPIMLFVYLLGATPFALRFTSVLVSILAVPLLYRLTLTMFWADSRRYWLALMAAGGLAMSFWHIGMSRIGLRFVLIPPFFMATAYLFWYGWRVLAQNRPKNAYGYFMAAGVILGLSQYTYLSARLFPVVFLLMGVAAWPVSRRVIPKLWPSPSTFWSHLLVMAITAVLVFAPLGVVFYNQSGAFSGRTNQVLFPIEGTAAGMVALAQHLAQALSLFWGGVDPRIRHHLIDRAVFDLLILLGFWLGLGVSLKQWRKPENLFLVISLVLLWLPAPLSVDPIHAPRSAGMLPPFFILVVVGLYQGVAWGVGFIQRRQIAALTGRSGSSLIGLIALGLVGFSGAMNIYAYFERWANHPLVYQEYKGPFIDLAREAAALSQTTDVVLPYELYVYPPVRYILQNDFREELALPFSPLTRPTDKPPIIYSTRLPVPPSPLVVWLTTDSAGQKVAYFTRFRTQPDPQAGQPVLDKWGTVIGHRLNLDEALLKQLYLENPLTLTPFTWAGHLRLAGYDLNSPAIAAGKPNTLMFYWENLKDADLNNKVFIQLINAQGRPISQLEEPLIQEDMMYYGVRDGFVLGQHQIWTGPETPAGLYLLRFGLFNPRTGERLPLTTADNQPAGDQIIGAPFYVVKDGVDPRRPDVSLPATLGESLRLLGYSPQQPLAQLPPTGLNLSLYWQATGPITADYTVFVQLLNAQNQVVSQVDAQPLAGLYPTSRWQPGQVVVSQFTLPMNEALLGSDYRLVTGMYELASGARLQARDAKGQALPDNMIVLLQKSLP